MEPSVPLRKESPTAVTILSFLVEAVLRCGVDRLTLENLLGGSSTTSLLYDGSESLGKKKEKSLPLIVDPIMGDKGTFYQGFSDAHLDHMRRLCQHADLVLPNLTEACLLLEEPYEDSLSEDRWEDYCKRLAELGPSKVLLTGLHMKENQIGVAYFDVATEEFNLFSSPALPPTIFWNR